MTHRLLTVGIFAAAATMTLQAQTPAPATPEGLVAAAKRAAGQDYSGTFLRICVAPDNLTTRDGIVVIDTLFDYASEPEIVDGLTALGLDPRNIKYVLISHAHGDHDQGAALLQSRFGAKVVMGAADWDATLQRPPAAAGGVPKRDISVGAEGTKITLGGTTIDVIATPGHTRGTLSYIFPVHDKGRTLTVAYAGGTAFNFPREAENFAIYRDSQKKMGDAARAAGATVLMTNHTEFDRAYDHARLAQLP